MSRYACFAALLAALVVVQNVNSADDKEKKETKDKKPVVKCPISGQKIDKAQARKYRDGKVYFCCPGCPGAFKPDKNDAHARKGNQQLVLTKQYVQKGCPLSGGKLNKDTAIKLAGAEVAFCCNNCKGKVEKAKGDDQLAMVFSNKAFEKAFKKKQ